MIKKINILGQTYKIYLGVSIDKDNSLANRFGYCSGVDKKIVIAELNTIDSWKDENSKVKQKQTENTIRHEIIHAFLVESGLWGSSNDTDSWATNEEMVDWIALQYPKMLSVFKKLGCVGDET